MSRTRPGCVVAAFAGVVLMCGSVATVIALSQRVLPNANLPTGYTALVCADVQLAPPRLQATILLPQLRSVSALFALPGRCVWLPWLPALPHNVHVHLP